MIYISIVVVIIAIALFIYRQISISKLSYSQCLEKLRRSRKLYRFLSETEKQSTYGRYLKKSIDYLEKRVNEKS